MKNKSPRLNTKKYSFSFDFKDRERKYPYDIPKEYHRCGIKGRPIRAKLPSGLTVKAKGPSNLARIVQRFGYWPDVEHDKLVKAISNAALHNKNCYGIPVWYK